MRALVVHPGPNYSVADVHRGWVQGLRANGVEVLDFNLDDRLSFYGQAHRQVDGEWVPMLKSDEAAWMAAKGIEAACFEWWPDVVFIISGFFVPPVVYRAIRQHGKRVITIHTESPYEDDRQIARAAFADLNVLNDPTNLERFREVAPTVFIPHAYDPATHRRQPPDPEAASDFCFVGTGYGSRAEFFEAVDWSGIDFALGGNWARLPEGSPLRKHLIHDPAECCPNDETARLYASTKASVNLYRQDASESADGWAMGPREIELAACGVFFLREPRPEGDGLFPMLPTFDGPDDFADQLRWWLHHDDERQAAAEQARLAVLDRTFTNHAAGLLAAL